MSEVTDQHVTSSAKPKGATPSRKAVAFSSIHVRYAKVKGIDETRAAKLNRSYIRSNFDAICKVWPELRKSQKQNRDGNRYPVTIPANVADAIVKRNVKGAK